MTSCATRLAVALFTCACASCWYEVADPASGASGGAGGEITHCPAAGCPDGSTCNEAEGVCELGSQQTCDGAVLVSGETRFRGDTCQGFDLPACQSSHQQLVLHVSPGASWLVVVSDGYHTVDVDGMKCEALTSGCNPELTLEGEAFFAVHRSGGGCGEVTIDVTPM